MELALKVSLNLTSSSISKKLYRVLHDVEMPWFHRGCQPCPEVQPLNGERTPFTPEWQRLAYALNPGMTGNHFRSLYGNEVAFMNSGNGFPTQPGDPSHADYVNLRDLSAPLPAFDKTRLCGGATISGIPDPPDLIVDILDGLGPAPALEQLLGAPTLYFHAVINHPNYVERFPQMNGGIVLVPLVGNGECRILLSMLQEVPTIADPYFYGYRPSPYV